jgi:hypothetical protein
VPGSRPLDCHDDTTAASGLAPKSAGPIYVNDFPVEHFAPVSDIASVIVPSRIKPVKTKNSYLDRISVDNLYRIPIYRLWELRG